MCSEKVDYHYVKRVIWLENGYNSPRLFEPLFFMELPFEQHDPRYIAAVDLLLWSNYEFDKAASARQFIRTLEVWRNPKMAKSRNTPQYTMPEMLNYKLNSEEKKGFEKWLKEGGLNWSQELGDVIAEDWKIGVSFDANNATYIASATQKSEKHDWYNLCVLSRHQEYQMGLALTVFKIHVLFRGRTLAQLTSEGDWG